MSTCPVCGLAGIAADKDQCPQCDADLTCFKVLDSLPEELPAERARPSKHPGLVSALGVLVVLLCALSGFQSFELRQVGSQLRDHESALLEYMGRIDANLHRLTLERPEQRDGDGTRDTGDGLEEQRGRVQAPIPHPAAELGADDRKAATPEPGEEASQRPEAGNAAIVEQREEARQAPAAEDDGMTRFRVYSCSGSDTLWGLSEKYYGAGRFYPVLMEHNPTVGIFSIKEGTPLKILKDGRSARKVYRKIVHRRGGKLYWWYTVMEGDTLSSIASKYYKDPETARIADFNPNPSLEAGRKLRIFIE